MTNTQSIHYRLAIAHRQLARDIDRLYANGMIRHAAEVEYLESQLATANDNEAAHG